MIFSYPQLRDEGRKFHSQSGRRNRIYTLIVCHIQESFPKCLTRILPCLILKHSIILFVKLIPVKYKVVLMIAVITVFAISCSDMEKSSFENKPLAVKKETKAVKSQKKKPKIKTGTIEKTKEVIFTDQTDWTNNEKELDEMDMDE